MRAVGYVRVSTQEQQRDGISIEHQKEKIRTYADLKGLKPIEIISDAGKSGKDLNRDGIETIINKIKAGEIRIVIVYKLDRISRKTKDILDLVEIFNEYKVAFHSITENIDTKTAMGKFFLTIMSALAQMERDLISERIRDVLAYKKEKGEWIGNVPIGYRYNKKTKVLEEEKKGLELIKKVKKLNRQGLSIREIAMRLNLGKSTIHKLINSHLKSYKCRYTTIII